MGCSCNEKRRPLITVDVPHNGLKPGEAITFQNGRQQRARVVACLHPERPVDGDTVWDFECEACLRHAHITVTVENPGCVIFIPGWPPRLPLTAALVCLEDGP